MLYNAIPAHSETDGMICWLAKNAKCERQMARDPIPYDRIMR
jgi:hypothetical protein